MFLGFLVFCFSLLPFYVVVQCTNYFELLYPDISLQVSYP